MKQSLPGITAIDYIECSSLPDNLEMKAMVGIPIGIFVSMTEVPFSGMPTCVTDSDYDSHAQVERSVLTFQSTEDLPIRGCLAFIIRDANGKHWLMGHKEAPYPVIKRTQHLGVPESEKAGYIYEVTLIGRKALVPVTV